MMSIMAKHRPIPCRIPDCDWRDHFSNLYDHFYDDHYQQLRNIKSDTYFQLTFDDLRNPDPILLSSDEGVYWFIQNDDEPQEGHFSIGLFEAGASRPVEYHIKLGLFATRFVQILGPFQSQEDKSNKYDFIMKFKYLKYLSSVMSSNVVIFFGDFHLDEDEYHSKYGPLCKLNMYRPENFVCYACNCKVRILSDPRSCENQHFLCDKCFKLVNESGCSLCVKIANNEPEQLFRQLDGLKI